MALTSAAATLEFLIMYRVHGALKLVGAALGGIIPVAVYLGHHVDALAAAFLLVAAIRLFARPQPENALSDLAPVVLGIVYIPGLLGFHIELRLLDAGLIIFLYGTIWMADAFAYYFGKSMGKRKLYPSMSPKKTVVGGVASVIGGAIGAVMLKYFLLDWMGYGAAAGIGLVLGSVAIVGDLAESMLKRDAGVKDSGTLIPGHGGFLDKIDGSLFAGAVLFWILKAGGQF